MLAVRSLDATCDVGRRVLDRRRLDEPDRPSALLFGNVRRNIDEVDRTFEPKAERPTPGRCDIYLVADGTLEEVGERPAREGVTRNRTRLAHRRPGRYEVRVFRDPDLNFVEVCTYSRTG